MKKLLFFFLLFILQLIATRAAIQEDSLRTYFICCRPDALAPAGIMTDHVHEKGKFALAYSVMNMTMRGNQNGTQAVSNTAIFNTYMMATDRMTMQMHMLMPMYGVTERFTVMAMLNYNINTMHMSMMPAKSMNMEGMTMGGSNTTATSMRSYGFSDTKLYALYNVLPFCNQRLIAGIGLSLPTGDTDVRGATMQSDYAIFPYGMQLGTGTYDLLPGLVYVKQANRFSWGAAVNASIKTGTNTKNYRLGNEYSISPWLAYKAKSWFSISARADYYSMGKIKGYDAEINLSSGNDAMASVANYGTQRASLAAGVNLYAPEHFLSGSRLLIEYGVPFYQNTTGLQSTVRSQLTARLQFEF